MALNTKLDLNQGGRSVSKKVYRGVIGSLLYFITNRLDIMFSVCLCVRFQSAPKKSHLTAVKEFLDIL